MNKCECNAPNHEFVLFLIFVFSCITFILGLVYGTISVKNKYESSAVKNGVGEWIVDKNEAVIFKWKKND